MSPTRQPQGVLQEQLRDLACLAVVGDHVRWVLRGPGAPELAGWLSGAATAWRQDADSVARAMADAGVPPDGRVRALARDIPWNWVPDGWLDADEGRRLLHDRLRRLVGWTRARVEQASPGAEAALIGGVLSRLEGQLGELDRPSGHT